jgi:hypothetical protein
MKTATVVFEEVIGGELLPSYELMSIFSKDGETYESVFSYFHPDGIFKGAYEDRNDAMKWIGQWRGAEK